MSHHHDSAEARKDPRLDISDTYLFRGTAGTVFMVNANPLSGAGGFHDDESQYEVRIDLDGDAVEDLVYRFTFGPSGPDGTQPWRLVRLRGAEAPDRLAPGEELATGRTGQAVETADGHRVFAGPAADPFWIEGSVVTAVRTAIAAGTAPDLSGFDPAAAANLFAGTDVQAIVLEVPDTALPAERIGFWASTVLATDAGGRRQIQRCGHPLLNTLFILEDEERHLDFNTTEPIEDLKRYGAQIAAEAGRAAAASGAVTDPVAHGERVRDTLFPDVLPYRVGSAASFTAAERNGRGLDDRAVEAMFELVLGGPLAMGLPNPHAGAPRSEFPYLLAPVAAGA